MNTKITNIAKNTSYFTFALIIQKILSFTYFIIIARAISPDDLGKYYFAISFTTIFSIFIDFGLANVLTREIARPETNRAEDNKGKANKYLGIVMAIKIPMAVLSWLTAIFIINFMGLSDTIKYLVYLSSICMILDSFTTTLYSVIRGFHNLIYESIGSILFMATALITGIVILKFNLGLVWLMNGLVFASIFNIIFSLIVIKTRFRLNLRPIYSIKLIKMIFAITWPFAAYAIFQKLYTYLDSVMLTTLAGERYNGLYQIPFKIINALQFFPLAFIATVYPAFSLYWHSNKEQVMITFERAMNYLIIISVPISIGTFALADKIIILFNDQYTEAILPLQITMLALIFMFMNYPIGALLNACDRQKDNTRNMMIVLISSVIINLFLIPIYKTIGASITVLVTNILMFILGIYCVPKMISLRIGLLLKFFLKILLSAIVMGFAVYYLKNFLNIFLVVLISGIIYFLLVFIFKTIKREDIVSIYHSFIKS